MRDNSIHVEFATVYIAICMSFRIEAKNRVFTLCFQMLPKKMRSSMGVLTSFYCEKKFGDKIWGGI